MDTPDIVDLIDAALDAGEPDNGFDFGDPTFPACRCGRDWHGLPITVQMELMAMVGEYDPEYRYADDDSLILCPGSEVEGPLRLIPFTEPETLGSGATVRRVTFGGLTVQEITIPAPDEPLPDDPVSRAHRIMSDIWSALDGLLTELDGCVPENGLEST